MGFEFHLEILYLSTTYHVTIKYTKYSSNLIRNRTLIHIRMDPDPTMVNGSDPTLRDKKGIRGRKNYSSKVADSDGDYPDPNPTSEKKRKPVPVIKKT